MHLFRVFCRVADPAGVFESGGYAEFGQDIDLKKDFHLLVLGSKQPAGDIEFNPSSSEMLIPGMTLIVMGEVENIVRAKSVF